ncbi:MAG: hypothetical protein LBT10_04175 [Methanobrevibacter sp.]|jgi:hypothetical protein|nr:hypothetical protein [Methanobrevibacter sp.]
MNFNTVKTIFKKEFRENIDLKYMKRMLFILCLFPIIILIMSGQGDDYGADSLVTFMSLISGFLFYCFSSQSLQRKFFEVKFVNGFQPLLVLPVTLKEIWFAKFLSIITTAYILMLITEALITIAIVIKLDIVVLTLFSLKILFMMLIVSPVMISVIIIISSWMALRFKDRRTIEYLNTISILAIMIGFISLFRFKYWFVGMDMNFVAIVGLIFAILIDIVFYYLISKIKKEML